MSSRPVHRADRGDRTGEARRISPGLSLPGWARHICLPVPNQRADRPDRTGEARRIRSEALLAGQRAARLEGEPEPEGNGVDLQTKINISMTAEDAVSDANNKLGLLLIK